jgi:hypothetical protein
VRLAVQEEEKSVKITIGVGRDKEEDRMSPGEDCRAIEISTHVLPPPLLV